MLTENISKKQLGLNIESQVLKYFISKNFLFVEKNYFKRGLGEIDLIFEKNKVLYFIEVRYKNNDNFGLAKNSLTTKKLKHLKDTINYFLLTNKKFAYYKKKMILCSITKSITFKLKAEWNLIEF